MLTLLLKRQKLWTVPLIISLALSWCLLFCQNMAQAVELPSTASHSEHLPPCHSKLAQLTATDTQLVLAEAPRSGCEQLAAGSEQLAAGSVPLQLASCAILVSWQSAYQFALLPAGDNSKPYWTQPPPQHGPPLYLRKNLLLI